MTAVLSQPTKQARRPFDASPALALWVGVFALILFWLTRLSQIDSFPFFLDEGLHVYFSEVTAQRHPFIYANKYYLFSLWWWTLFAVPFAAPVWLSRVVTVLAVLPGVAAVIGLGRQTAGMWGALLGAILYLFSTYHYFFERLALADPLSASAVLVAIYFAARLARRANRRDAMLTGICVFLAIGFKLSALPYLGIPLAAYVALRPPSTSPAERRQWLTTALVTEGVLVGLFILMLVVVGRNPFANAADHVGLSEGGIAEVLARLPHSASMMYGNLVAFITSPGALLVGFALVKLLLTRHFFLLLCLIPPALVFLLSDMQSSRYYAAPMGVLLLCVAVSLSDWGRLRRVALLPMLLVLVWGLNTWQPFAARMNRAPLHLSLPVHDREEYLRSDASGVVLTSLRDALASRQPERVIGVMANCQGLRYVSFGRFPVECPTINPNGDTIPDLEDLMESSRQPGVYAVLEAISYLPQTAPGRVAASIHAANSRPGFRIYRLAG